MQLLAEFGSEGGGIEGLGLIEGDVEKLRPDDPSPRIPHMGWNEVHLTRECPLVDSTIDGSDFYFVHSYHLIPRNSDQLVATTPYCGDFASIVADTNILGVQFHPEKSQKLGLRLLSHLMAN
jgi:glutamine amidotransferase